MRNHIAAVGCWRQFLVVEKDCHIRRAADDHRFHSHKIPASKTANQDDKQQNQDNHAERASSWLCRRIIARRCVNRRSNLWSWFNSSWINGSWSNRSWLDSCGGRIFNQRRCGG